MNLTRVDSIIQFTQGSSTVWNDINVPVPVGAVVIDIVNKIIKEGDGTTLYSDLPVCLDYDFSGGVSGIVIPEGSDLGVLGIAKDAKYSPSTVKLDDILASFTTLANKAAEQQSRIDEINANNIILSITPGTTDGTVVICNEGKYGPGLRTLNQLISDLISSAALDSTTMHITDLVWYSDSGLTQPVITPNDVIEGATYWCVVTGFHDTSELSNVDFGMVTSTPNITITSTAGIATSGVLVSVYGGSGADIFYGMTIDTTGNIVCVGNRLSGGIGGMLVVKFDSNFAVLSYKYYVGSTSDKAFDVITDSHNNVIFVGNASHAGHNCPVVVKLDSNLNTLFAEYYGDANDGAFNGVCVDLTDNVICVGYTTEGGTVNDGLIVKFDSSLVIIARKRYGGSGDDQFNDVVVDKSGYIVCVGYCLEGSGTSDALIIKFDANLGIVTRKRYGGAGADFFRSVAVNSQNVLICTGWTLVSPGVYNALIVKLDNNLSIVTQKHYVCTVADLFRAVTVDQSDNIILVGSAYAAPTYDALIIKLDTNFNIITQKYYGGSANDRLYDVAVDQSGNIICAGYVDSGTSDGNSDTLLIRFPNDVPTGAFTGTILNALTLGDLVLPLVDSANIATNSALTLSTTALTLVPATVSASTPPMVQKTDTIVAARNKVATKLITAAYSSSTDDKFIATAVDYVGNIVAVGTTVVGGVTKALILKFSATFVPMSRRIFSGSYASAFNSVVVDSSNNVICVGSINSTSGGDFDGLIVKFDPLLTTVIGQKIYGSTGNDELFDVTIDPTGDIVAVGYTASEGSGLFDGLIVKFHATDLSLAARKTYGGSGNDVLNGVVIDSMGNIICVGYTSSEGVNTSGLILKLSSALAVVSRKFYNSTLGTGTEFAAVVVNQANEIFCVGRVIIATGNQALIVKFDSNVNAMIKVLYGNIAGSTELTGVTLDSAGNVVCAGKTNAEGAGSYDALVLKFSRNLALSGRKTYGSIGMDADVSCAVTSTDDIILSGYSVINGSTDAVVTKLPSVLPTGCYTNKYYTDLILADSSLMISADTATVANSNTTLSDSALVLSAGALSLGNATGSVVADITIMDAVSNVFKVAIGKVVTVGDSISASFVVNADDGSKTVTKTMSTDILKRGILSMIYGGAGYDRFNAVTIDSLGSIIAVGYTASEGAGNWDGLVVKLDASFNILARKRYGGATSDQFYDVAVDGTNNIFCVGDQSGHVVKFDTNLNVIVHVAYSNTVFRGVAVNSVGHVFAAGYGSDSRALIVKFNTNLGVIASTNYGFTGQSHLEWLYDIAIDSLDNVIVVGRTEQYTYGQDGALVMKFDKMLNIIAQKYYYKAGYSSVFLGVAVDALDNIICVGYSNGEGTGSTEGIVVKFDSSLTMLYRKYCGGSGNDILYNVDVSYSGNIVCVGSTTTEGVGTDAVILVLTQSLGTVTRKRLGGGSADVFLGVVTDSFSNIICAGYTASAGAGVEDALLTKLPITIPSGTFSGTTLTTMTYADSNLAVTDSTLTLAASLLTFTNPALTVDNTTYTVSNSSLSQAVDRTLSF